MCFTSFSLLSFCDTAVPFQLMYYCLFQEVFLDSSASMRLSFPVQAYNLVVPVAQYQCISMYSLDSLTALALLVYLSTYH